METSFLPVLGFLLLGVTHQLQALSTSVPARLAAPPASVVATPGGVQGGGVAAGADDTTSWEMVGSCRATCVEQTLQWPPTDDMCLQDHHCVTCWQLCELLYQDELKWRSACAEDTCSSGCTTACRFLFNAVLMPENLPLEFLDSPSTVEVSDAVLHVSWETPTPRRPAKKETPKSGRQSLVYTLLFKDDGVQHWGKVTATLDLITQVDGPHATFPGLHFLLIASSPTGTVARAVPPYPVSPTTPSGGTAPPTTAATVNTPSPTDVALLVRISTTDVGKLQAEVAWFQETLPQPEVGNQQWVVTWTRLTCNVNPSNAHCPLARKEMTAYIKSTDLQDLRLILTGLTFNSEYTLTLTLEGSSMSASAVVFYTPVCIHIETDFMRCRPSTTTVVPLTSELSTYKMTTQNTITHLDSTTKSKADVPASQPIPEEKCSPRLYLSLTSEVLLVSACVSLGCVFLMLFSLCVYRRWCRSAPELDMAKVLRSYSQLPLLNDNPNTPHRSMASLHQFQLHNATAHNSLITPAQPLRPQPQRNPLQTGPAHLQTQYHCPQTPSGAPQTGMGTQWGSIQRLSPGMAIYVTPPPTASPGTETSQEVTMAPHSPQPQLTINAPSQYGNMAGSLQIFTDDHHSHQQQHLTSQFYGSNTDLNCSAQEYASQPRINFADDSESPLPPPPPEAALPEVYHPVLTVPLSWGAGVRV